MLWATTTGSIFNDDVGKAFKEAYQEAYNREPGASNAGNQYDCIWAWARAAALASDPEDYDQVGENITKLVFRGINGAYNIVDQTLLPYPAKIPDPSLGMPLQTYQIQNGEQVMISPEPYSTGKFQTPSWLK